MIMKLQRILPLAACLIALGIAPALATTTASQTEQGSARYTSALNAFMAHGWHAVTDMHLSNGKIVGRAVNSKGQVHSVTFDPGSGSVKAS
jgi:hypothetical protein